VTWTYGANPYDPDLNASGSKIDAVRLEIGDTNEADQLLQDEEITYYLRHPLLYAAAYACEAVSAKYARQVDKMVGRLRISATAKAQQYRDLSAMLKRRAALGTGIYAGGLSVNDKQSTEQDSDRVAPVFTRTTQEYPGTDPSFTDYDTMTLV
jgi:hypothetical protein